MIDFSAMSSETTIQPKARHEVSSVSLLDSLATHEVFLLDLVGLSHKLSNDIRQYMATKGKEVVKEGLAWEMRDWSGLLLREGFWPVLVSTECVFLTAQTMPNKAGWIYWKNRRLMQFLLDCWLRSAMVLT